jgi:chromosome condensin MukBEF MukE localization factor
MGHDNQENLSYNFLENTQVEKSFADLNIKLLSGRHIHNDEYALYSILEDYHNEFQIFYKRLYKLDLIKGLSDLSGYYYLDFFDAGKGRLSDQSRYKALTELQTITGLMLLDMYYSKYFDNPKEIKWADIKHEIEEGDQKENYQRLFFDTSRSGGFTGKEWAEIERKFKQTINSFNELGWVKKLSTQNDELHFEINPSIHRMAKLYEKELADFDTFSSLVKPHEE